MIGSVATAVVIVSTVAVPQDRVVTEGAPASSPDRARGPDHMVDADQLTKLRPDPPVRRNVELILGLFFIVAILAYALLREPRRR